MQLFTNSPYSAKQVSVQTKDCNGNSVKFISVATPASSVQVIANL